MFAFRCRSHPPHNARHMLLGVRSRESFGTGHAAQSHGDPYWTKSLEAYVELFFTRKRSINVSKTDNIKKTRLYLLAYCCRRRPLQQRPPHRFWGDSSGEGVFLGTGHAAQPHGDPARLQRQRHRRGLREDPAGTGRAHDRWRVDRSRPRYQHNPPKNRSSVEPARLQGAEKRGAAYIHRVDACYVR